MSKKFISEVKVNEQIDSCFMLRKKNLRLTKYDKPYLELSLSDKTGRIEARLWEKAEEFNETIDPGDVVRARGIVEKYRDENQLKIELIEKADDRAFVYEDMVRVAENRKEIYGRIVSLLESIENPWIRSLSERFTSDSDMMRDFADGIGGKSWHNAYIGGLMEHTYEVMIIVDRMCGLYPEADRDTAIFGSFIHDMGKVFELDAKKMEYTIEGGLVGHIVIGHTLLMKKIGTIVDFPPELSLRLEHIVLSHHGEYEQQSPVLPKTLEATIIYQADELVSQANAIKEIQLSQAAEGRPWSSFVSFKNRKYYIKDMREENWFSGHSGKDEKKQSGKSPKNADAEKDLFKA